MCLSARTALGMPGGGRIIIDGSVRPAGRNLTGTNLFQRWGLFINCLMLCGVTDGIIDIGNVVSLHEIAWFTSVSKHLLCLWWGVAPSSWKTFVICARWQLGRHVLLSALAWAGGTNCSPPSVWEVVVSGSEGGRGDSNVFSAVLLMLSQPRVHTHALACRKSGLFHGATSDSEWVRADADRSRWPGDASTVTLSKHNQPTMISTWNASLVQFSLKNTSQCDIYHKAKLKCCYHIESFTIAPELK